MILHENKTFLAYRCPRCGSGVIGIAGSFALSGGRLLKLKCPCGGSELTVTETTDKNLRVSVPCMLCNGEHTYLVSPTLFYGRDLFLLSCSYSGLDICFIGEEERVSEALKQNEETLREMFADAGLASLAKMHGNEDTPVLPDIEVLEIIRFLVRDLEDEGKIDCPCHNGEYELNLTEDGVLITCLNCGGHFLCPVGSVEAAQDFLSRDRIVLTDPSEN